MASQKFLRAARRETIIIVVLYVLFFAWWYLTAYGLGDCEPSQYSYILGFPAWFFYSCIVGYVGITVILWAAVKFFFTDLPLDDEPEEDER